MFSELLSWTNSRAAARAERRVKPQTTCHHFNPTPEKLIKIGAKVVRPGKYVTFQMAEVAVPGELFAAILERIQCCGVPPGSLSGQRVSHFSAMAGSWRK